MKYLAAYALCQLSGKKPTKEGVKAVLKAAGVNVDEARVQELFTNFDGKDFDKTVADGLKKIGSAGPAAGAATAAPAAKADEKKGGGKKEEKKKAPEPEPEEDDDMMGGLF